MDTKRVVESLLMHSKNKDRLEKALTVGRVLSDERAWTSKNNTELNIHIAKFSSPSIMITIGLTVIVYVITASKSNSRLLDLITIEGHISKISETSRSKLIANANKSLNIKEFMPFSNLKQIIWIPYKDKKYVENTSIDVEMDILYSDKKSNINMIDDILIFNEHIDRKWYINEETSNPNPLNTAITTQREIINNIIKEI